MTVCPFIVRKKKYKMVTGFIMRSAFEKLAFIAEQV